MPTPTHRNTPRVPRAYLDPVDNPADALAIIALAMAEPLCDEVLAFMLDDQGRGGVITVVSETRDDDAALRVAELLCRAAETNDSLCSLVVATVRPHLGLVAADEQRWLDLDALTTSYGIELTEWFVIGPDGPALPRTLTGEPDRW
jgi:hypothetical protein